MYSNADYSLNLTREITVNCIILSTFVSRKTATTLSTNTEAGGLMIRAFILYLSGPMFVLVCPAV